MGANVPGKARVFMPYIGGVATYARKILALRAPGARAYAAISSAYALALIAWPGSYGTRRERATANGTISSRTCGCRRRRRRCRFRRSR